MKTKLILASALAAFSLMAQTNSPVSVFVEVPSFTIAFPGTMTPSEIGDVLKKYYGTNLTFIFTVTNGQTHEQLKFTGNSMPSMDKIRQLFAVQRQNPPPNGFILDATPPPANDSATNSEIHQYKVTDNFTGKSYLLTGKGDPPTEEELQQLFGQQTNGITPRFEIGEPQAVPSATLTAFRKNYPQFAKIPDSQVVLAIGEKFPGLLQKDKQFAEEFAKYSTAGPQSLVSDTSNDIEERKAAALERQADALERQANALEDQTLAQERAADAAEEQAFQQEMLNDDIDFRLDTLQIQNMTPPLTSPTLPIIPIAPIQQADHPRFIIVPGQGTYVVSPERPGQPQIITGPRLNGPIIVSP